MGYSCNNADDWKNVFFLQWNLKVDIYNSHLKGQCHEIVDSQWDRGSGFSGFNETAEAESAVSMRPPNLLLHRGSFRLIPLKEYYIKNEYIHI
jgi:hypothetical protein